MNLLPVLRLHYWLVLSYLVVFALPVLALVGTGALANDLRMQTQEDLDHQAQLLAMFVSSELAHGVSLSALSPALTDAKRATLAGFRIVDPDGKVVASSGGDLGDVVSDDPEVAAALAGADGTDVRPRDPGGAFQQPLASRSRRADVRVFVAVPIVHDAHVVGAVVLSRTPREELQTFWQMAPRLFVGVLIALAGTVALAISSGRILSRSLEGLGRASQRIAGGDDEAPEIEHASRSHVSEARALASAMASMSARLRERLRYISDFAGNVSHEFKTPVSSLRGTVELLRDDEAMPPEQRTRFLDNAMADLDRLSRLVGGLLRLARAEEGGPREAVSLDHLMAVVRSRHEQVTVEGNAGCVIGNAEQLEAALTNLVENAYRYGGPAVNVRAVCWRADGHAGVDVVDDGPGISAANLPRIFDRFFTTDRLGGGTGLGLAFVRAVCHSHGGRVDAESEPGRTRFRIVLPASA